MRTKGAIWTLAIVLTLACIYQLSFTAKTYVVRERAKKYAHEKYDPSTRNNSVDSLTDHYVDSITRKKFIYNFFGLKKYSYRECQEREINLGLDLRGGMNVILEVSIADVIKSLANYSKDTTFNKAIALAKKRQLQTNEDFVTLFGKAFEEINPDGKMAALFLYKLKDRIDYNSDNDEVLDAIREETDDAIENSYNIIRTRIDHFGVVQPNVQKLEGGERILVELPGVEEKERVRKLLNRTANLEFWATYENSEVYESLLNANKVVKAYLDEQKRIAEESAASKPKVTEEKTLQVPDKGSTAEEKMPSLVADIDSTEGKGTEAILSQMEVDSMAIDSLRQKSLFEEFPLFSKLRPYVINEDQLMPGCRIGWSFVYDTAVAGQYMRLAMEKGVFPQDFRYFWSAEPMEDPDNKYDSEIFTMHAIKANTRDGRAPLNGDVITSARESFDQVRGTAEVLMTMNSEGTKEWAKLTRENVGRVIAISMDNLVFSDPRVSEEINTGSSRITGVTVSEAQDLANLLKSGTLPAPCRIVQEEVIGPSLGKASIRSGLISFIIAFIVILSYMIFYYSHRAGLIADIALLTNMFFIIGVLASLQAALTLPGIAGIVLTIGMSVDANVLIYERIREEVAAGKGIKLAIADGYKNAYSAIIDSNLTTGITGVILLLVGTGPIKGFATTLVIGICTSLFSAIFITRLIFEMYLKNANRITFATTFTKGAFKNININFLGNRKPYYIISLTLIVVSIVSLIYRGLDQGVDFTGGRNYIIEFNKPVRNVNVAAALENEFGERPKVIMFGSQNKVRISTQYKINDDDPEVDDEIQHKLYAGLAPMLGDSVSFKDFSTNYWQGTQKVGPTIADDIKRQAVIAIFFALVFMFLYILFRFRNWQFGLGAVAALVHDSLLILGLFSLFYGAMPFSLEIDQTFIAAILTVVGYSVNDTVVVFDRIREYLREYRKRETKEIINMALNSTLSRTFNTSMSTFIVLLTIFIFGGESIKGFTFALLVGIVVGTYSSLFIATPLVYDTIGGEESKRILSAKRKT
jgi:SecD/SecF fusion protein